MESAGNEAKVVVIKEVFILLKIDTKAGRRANIIKPDDYYANTNLARLLAKAHALENKLINEARVPFGQFCINHKISPRYLRAIISLNNLSPKDQEGHHGRIRATASKRAGNNKLWISNVLG